jgi:chorismate-pyruvate lyase
MELRAGEAIKMQFDPLSDLFIAQFARPAGVSGVNLRALTPFQRALLVIDGTVTKFIEAYVMEPVKVRILGNDWHRLSAEHTWLEADAGTTVIAREVLLEGEYSATLYGHALSLIVPDRLPEAAQQQLTEHPGGLGRILLDIRLESRREVLWYGRELARDMSPELSEAIRSRMAGGCLTRTYRIINSGRPVMLIHERFPMNDDRLPSQI